MEPSPMKLPEIADGLYPMRAVTRLTGLNPDTIRVWERRYDAVAPDRTGGNARRYSSTQVRRLLMLREAVNRGHAISDVAKLDDSALDGLLGATSALDIRSTEPHEGGDGMFAQLAEEYLGAIARFDTYRAASILNRAAILLDSRDFALYVVGPILREVGERWHRGEMSVAQEHIVSVQVKSLLFQLMRFAAAYTATRKILLATPEGHHHEFGVLIAAVIAGGRGYAPTYLGPNVPFDDLIVASDLARAEIVILSVISTVTESEAAVLAAKLELLATRTTTWLGCPPDHPVTPYLTNVRVFHRYEDMDAALTVSGNR